MNLIHPRQSGGRPWAGRRGRLGGGSDSWGVVKSDETCGRM